jgi:pimeloyl-ACP methyl ester carboxylesterase
MISFIDFFMPSSDGLRLHARIYGAENQTSTPVVCLPGLTRNAHDFHELATRLSSDDLKRRVIVIEYRGRGGSERDPYWRHYTVGVEAIDVRQMLKALRVNEAIFVGTSRGGLITMALAATVPLLIKASVLNDIGPVIETEGLRRIASYVGKGTMPKDWEAAVRRLKDSNRDFTDLTDEEWENFARAVFIERKDKSLALSYDPALGNTLVGIDFSKPFPSAWPLFELLKAYPVLTVRGENSDLLSEATLAEMARRHPTMETLIVPNEAHAPFVGRERTAKAIADFVGRVA